MFILECTDTVQLCYNSRKIIVIVQEFIKILQWSVPLLLVFLGTWDMFKAVTKGNDEKAVQDAGKTFVRRLVYGVVVFLIPFLIRLVLSLVESNILANSNGDVSATSWIGCWNNASNKNSSYFSGCSSIYSNSNTN